MELKIDEIFNFHGIILQVYKAKDSDRCKGCFFENYPLSLCPPHTCVAIGRKDKKNIIFKKLINKMTREETKELLPFIQAFAEGKIIEHSLDGKHWQETYYPSWNKNLIYRIKPEPKYRPFKTQEECWNEMLKHQPFGWIKGNETGEYKQVVRVYNYMAELIFNISYNSPADYSPEMMFSSYTFTDGTPFGIKEE